VADCPLVVQRVRMANRLRVWQDEADSDAEGRAIRQAIEASRRTADAAAQHQRDFDEAIAHSLAESECAACAPAASPPPAAASVTGRWADEADSDAEEEAWRWALEASRREAPAPLHEQEPAFQPLAAVDREAVAAAAWHWQDEAESDSEDEALRWALEASRQAADAEPQRERDFQEQAIADRELGEPAALAHPAAAAAAAAGRWGEEVADSDEEDEVLRQAFEASRQTADAAAQLERDFEEAVARSLAEDPCGCRGEELPGAPPPGQDVDGDALALALALSAAEGGGAGTGGAAAAEAGVRGRLAEALQHRVMAGILEGTAARGSHNPLSAATVRELEQLPGSPGAVVLAEVSPRSDGHAKGERAALPPTDAAATPLADAEAEAEAKGGGQERPGVAAAAMGTTAHYSLAEEEGEEEGAKEPEARAGAPDGLDKWWCIEDTEEAEWLDVGTSGASTGS